MDNLKNNMEVLIMLLFRKSIKEIEKELKELRKEKKEFLIIVNNYYESYHNAIINNESKFQLESLEYDIKSVNNSLKTLNSDIIRLEKEELDLIDLIVHKQYEIKELNYLVSEEMHYYFVSSDEDKKKIDNCCKVYNDRINDLRKYIDLLQNYEG